MGSLTSSIFDMLADIQDKAGNLAGYCVVELLPGAHNKKTPISAAFSRVK
jgi:hypothetical protein